MTIFLMTILYKIKMALFYIIDAKIFIAGYYFKLYF